MSETYENEWCALRGEPMKLSEARKLPLIDRHQVFVRLESGALIRPWRFVGEPEEALADISATVDDVEEHLTDE